MVLWFCCFIQSKLPVHRQITRDVKKLTCAFYLQIFICKFTLCTKQFVRSNRAKSKANVRQNDDCGTLQCGKQCKTIDHLLRDVNVMLSSGRAYVGTRVANVILLYVWETWSHANSFALTRTLRSIFFTRGCIQNFPPTFFKIKIESIKQKSVSFAIIIARLYLRCFGFQTFFV